jgi:hypothetical protein
MTTHSYFIQVRPTQLHAQIRRWPTLESTAQAFAGATTECEIRPLVTTDEGNHDIELRLQRDQAIDAEAHVQAVNAIFTAVQSLGYVVLRMEVRNIVSASVDYAIKGALGGGGAGAIGTKNPYLTLAGLVLGALAGHVAGESVEHVKVIYEVRADRAGGWSLVPASQSQTQAVAQPA